MSNTYHCRVPTPMPRLELGVSDCDVAIDPAELLNVTRDAPVQDNDCPSESSSNVV